MDHRELPTLAHIGKDVATSSRTETLWVLARPFLWVAAFFAAALAGLWPLLPVIVFALFLCVAVAAHDTAHGSLRLSRRERDVALFVIGALVLESGHAYRLTHLRHHAAFPGPDDPEGEAAKYSVWRSLVIGPAYLPRLWWWAFRRASPTDRRWLLAEAIVAGSMFTGSVALVPWSVWPLVYAVTVVVGSWAYPLATAHLPHRSFGDDPLTQARTLRGRVVSALLLGMSYHLEHHLYPGVPTHKLAELSRRLEPFFAASGVKPVKVP